MVIQGSFHKGNTFHNNHKKKSKRTRIKIKPNDEIDFYLYLFLLILFLFGIVLGCIFFRNSINSDSEIEKEIMNKVATVSEVKDSAHQEILTKSILKNLKILLFFWVIGVSIIGSPFLVILFCYKGFKISFLVSSLLMKYRLYSW